MDHQMYRLLCTAFVLKRKMTDDLSQIQSKCKEEIEFLTKKLQDVQPPKKLKTAIDDFVILSKIECQKMEMEQKLSKLRKEPDIMAQKFTQLIPDHVPSLVILSNSKLHPKQELFTKDAHRCPKCGRLFLFDSMTHLNHCEACKIVTRALFVVEDKQTEVISFVNQKQPLLEQNQLLLNQHPCILKTNRTALDRVKLYRDYLAQFLETAPMIPEFVLTSLYLNFQNIHVLNSLKCKLSSVEKHLNQDPELAPFAPMSVRIFKLFSGEPCPMLPTEIYDKLVQRFIQISEASNKLKSKVGKLPSLEILTHFFLRWENRDDLAIYFLTHKNMPAIKDSKEKMKLLLSHTLPISQT